MPKGGKKGPEYETGRIRFREIGDFPESFEGVWDLEYQQLGRMDRQGGCRYAKDGTGVVYEERFGATIGLRGSVAEGLFALHLTDERGRSGRWQGEPAPRDAFAYGDAGKELDVLMPRGTRNLAAVLPIGPTREQIERLVGGSFCRCLPEGAMFRPTGPSRRRQLVSDLTGVLDELPAGGVGLAVVEALARAIEAPSEFAVGPTKSARRLFRRAMELCEGSDLVKRPADMALELDVSLRTLEMAFRACMDMPPARYLRLLRLNRVRERLLAMEPGEGQVGQVALDFGFSQPGRFAGEYRRLFGELPSESLAKRRPARCRPALG